MNFFLTSSALKKTYAIKRRFLKKMIDHFLKIMNDTFRKANTLEKYIVRNTLHGRFFWLRDMNGSCPEFNRKARRFEQS